jgi:hypothetical protein
MTNMTNMNVYGLKVESGRWNRAKALVPSTHSREGDVFRATISSYDVKVPAPFTMGQVSCTCVDWKTHGLAESVACKHILALAMRVGEISHDGSVVQSQANKPAKPQAGFRKQVSDAISIAIEKLGQTVKAVIEAGDVPILVGPTGTGKTSAVRRVSHWLGASMYEVSGSESYTDSDLVGVTMPTGLKFPGVIARAAGNAQEGFPSLLFFDEFTRFSPRAAEGLLRLLLPIGLEDARMMGFSDAPGAVRATSAPFWGDVWMPVEDCPIVLACNPWGQPLDPALLRRTVPVWAGFDPQVASLFSSKVSFAITTSWKSVDSGELPLPIEYGEIARAIAPDDFNIIQRYRDRLRVLDPSADEAFGLMMKGVS